MRIEASKIHAPVHKVHHRAIVSRQRMGTTRTYMTHVTHGPFHCRLFSVCPCTPCEILNSQTLNGTSCKVRHSRSPTLLLLSFQAPGEALNVLLRILNERKFGNEEIPLLCAIATANPGEENRCHVPGHSATHPVPRNYWYKSTLDSQLIVDTIVTVCACDMLNGVVRSHSHHFCASNSDVSEAISKLYASYYE